MSSAYYGAGAGSCPLVQPDASGRQTGSAVAQEEGNPARWADRHARELFSILATILLSTLLSHEVSPGILTVAWALEGLVLLAIGFPAGESILRRSGLLLLGVCIVKVLGYDLQQLDALTKILSFTLLGAVLIAVSWIYTKFGTRLRHYL